MKIGFGELLFGIVIILGIIGTVSFFAFDDLLGEYQTTFMIASSLAFIASFFVLSVYARSKKRSHLRRVNVDRALANWIQYAEVSRSTVGEKQRLPEGTLESIAIHVFTNDGYRLVQNSANKPDAYVRLMNEEGQVDLIQCRTDPDPIGLPQVIAFYEVFHAEKAAWGEIWSPGGFLADAVNWVGKRPITLRNAADIQHIVDSLVEKRKESPTTNS